MLICRTPRVGSTCRRSRRLAPATARSAAASREAPARTVASGSLCRTGSSRSWYGIRDVTHHRHHRHRPHPPAHHPPPHHTHRHTTTHHYTQLHTTTHHYTLPHKNHAPPHLPTHTHTHTARAHRHLSISTHPAPHTHPNPWPSLYLSIPLAHSDATQYATSAVHGLAPCAVRWGCILAYIGRYAFEAPLMHMPLSPAHSLGAAVVSVFRVAGLDRRPSRRDRPGCGPRSSPA